MQKAIHHAMGMTLQNTRLHEHVNRALGNELVILAQHPYTCQRWIMPIPGAKDSAVILHADLSLDINNPTINMKRPHKCPKTKNGPSSREQIEFYNSPTWGLKLLKDAICSFIET